jgi:hypothetical protein
VAKQWRREHQQRQHVDQPRKRRGLGPHPSVWKSEKHATTGLPPSAHLGA